MGNRSLAPLFIVDGAQHSAFGLPHFTALTKIDAGAFMKFHVLGILENFPVKPRLSFFKLSKDFDKGGNHVIEPVYLYSCSCQARAFLPQKFFVEMNYCKRKSKNWYFLGYLKCLVCWKFCNECSSFLSARPIKSSIRHFCVICAASEQTLLLHAQIFKKNLVRPTVRLQQSQQWLASHIFQCC